MCGVGGAKTQQSSIFIQLPLHAAAAAAGESTRLWVSFLSVSFPASLMLFHLAKMCVSLSAACREIT